ncbi:Spindle assembly abnormal protein 6 [Trypanosoma cruzi]|uniref:Spindle assembly abnormal protein 6 n=1 Tax=Trypanosoma cruzi TaxID=5693 RepID=A0A2V2UFU3_TRYCR|nr:Spindle assembly abnormal protein 6 [Trypanosoma cruzi]
MRHASGAVEGGGREIRKESVGQRQPAAWGARQRSSAAPQFVGKRTPSYNVQSREVQAQLMEDVRTKDRGLQEANQRVALLESSVAKLQSQLRVAGDKCDAQAKELEELRSSNHELRDFRSNATRSISDNELNCVKLQERLRGLVLTLKSRDEEAQSLRDQYQKQDSYIHILTSQNDQLTEQNKKNEVSLKKAHHIISTQLRHIKGRGNVSA